MEVLMGFVAIIGSLVALDIAALKWGKDARRSEWLQGKYDARNDWNACEC